MLYQVYCDGSYKAPHLISQAFLVKSAQDFFNKKVKVLNDTKGSNSLAEIGAVTDAMKYMLSEIDVYPRDTITIYSDSKQAIELFEFLLGLNEKKSDFLYLKHPTIYAAKDICREFLKNHSNSILKFQWIKSHTAEINGNRYVDRLAVTAIRGLTCTR